MPKIAINLYDPSIKGLKPKVNGLKELHFRNRLLVWKHRWVAMRYLVQESLFPKANPPFKAWLSSETGTREQREMCLRSIILVASRAYSPSTSLFI